MVDMGILVGTFRRFGQFGPPYEVLEPAPAGRNGEARMRVRLIESGELAEYSVASVLTDPVED